MSQLAQVDQPSIGTVTASKDTTVDPRTGEPRRPVLVWIATALLYAGAATVTTGLLWAFWHSVHAWEQAAWLNNIVPTEPGDLIRVAIVTGLFAIAMAIDAAALIAGYHAWRGYRWSRWAGIVAVVLSIAGLAINPIAAWGMAPIALGAALLWLPPVRRFLDRWHVRRHPQPLPPVTACDVQYGPLPRYR